MKPKEKQQVEFKQIENRSVKAFLKYLEDPTQDYQIVVKEETEKALNAIQESAIRIGRKIRQNSNK